MDCVFPVGGFEGEAIGLLDDRDSIGVEAPVPSAASDVGAAINDGVCTGAATTAGCAGGGGVGVTFVIGFVTWVGRTEWLVATVEVGAGRAVVIGFPPPSAECGFDVVGAGVGVGVFDGRGGVE